MAAREKLKAFVTKPIGLENFRLAVKIGLSYKKPVLVEEKSRRSDELGQTFVIAEITGPTRRFWKKLRKAEDELPLPTLPPISPYEHNEPIEEEYTHLQCTSENL